MDKKANAGVILIAIIIIIVVLYCWTIVLNRECRSNKDCNDEEYCGSDFACHQIPIIERTIVKTSPVLPILFICMTIVALALIWRWEKIFGRKEKKSDIETTKETESPETYYSSQFQYSAK